MQVNLIALCTEETSFDICNNICPLVQEKLNMSTVEVYCTTVFSDLYAIKQHLQNCLSTPCVIVGDFDNNIDINLVKKILTNQFHTQPKIFDAGFFVSDNQSSCLVINSGKFNFCDYLRSEIICDFYHIVRPVVFLKVFGLDKLSILQKLMQTPHSSSFYYSVYVANLEGQISISPRQQLDKPTLQNYLREIYEQFNEYIYTDNEKTMLQVLDEILTLRHINISVADILTQGALERFLRDGLPNFDLHIVQCNTLFTLEDIANTLHVAPDFLATHKKDSVELCYEMGVAMMEYIPADMALVLSGSFHTPYLGIGDNQTIHVFKYNFNHAPDYITKIMCKQAIFKLLKKLREN